VALAAATGKVRLQEGDACDLPFADGQFDAVTFTYLLRYVDDPAATLAELARVVRPGATVAGLEFALPHGIWRPLWELHVRVALPAAGVVARNGWGEVGSFLGPSIRGYWSSWPLERQLDAWHDAGIVDVTSKRLSVGGGIVTWGRKR
jgi:demethylmenaquinone methyltransferase/2-methoxy-6-polyprenyl-1,4-benzoquinol methylase